MPNLMLFKTAVHKEVAQTPWLAPLSSTFTTSPCFTEYTTPLVQVEVSCGEPLNPHKAPRGCSIFV